MQNFIVIVQLHMVLLTNTSGVGDGFRIEYLYCSSPLQDYIRYHFRSSPNTRHQGQCYHGNTKQSNEKSRYEISTFSILADEFTKHYMTRIILQITVSQLLVFKLHEHIYLAFVVVFVFTASTPSLWMRWIDWRLTIMASTERLLDNGVQGYE